VGTPGSDRGRHRAFLAFVATASAVVLLSTARSQITDTNFVVLWEAVSLLNGDRLLIDLFEWGAPLAALLSTAVQWLVGYRLIGEIALQWAFMIAGVTLAYDLAARVTRSYTAALLTLPLTLIVLSNTLSYHWSKLFFFPLGLWLAWRYIERPGPWRAVALGVATAAAFLTRHDYLVYLGFVSALALLLAPIVAGRWTVGPWVRDAAAAALTAALCVAPWLAFVQAREGVASYVQLRLSKNEAARPGAMFRSLLSIDPAHVFDVTFGLPVEAGEIGFIWNPDVPEPERRALEARLHLQLLEGRDSQGRLRYSVPNVNNRDLLALDRYILDGHGIPWDSLKTLPIPWPSLVPAMVAIRWLQQMSVVLSLALIGSVIPALARWRRGRGLPLEKAQVLAAGALLLLCAVGLFREPSYIVVTAPLASAMTARLLDGRHSQSAPWRRGLSAIARGLVMVVLALTTFAAIGWARPPLLMRPRDVPSSVRSSLSELVRFPPEVSHPLYTYLRDCTVSGDHIVVSGSTPFDVPYFTRRPVAGGHLYWQSGWGSDRAHEAQSLALLQRQAVPFVFSTREPVLDVFKVYPAIREHLLARYQDVPGTQGHLLADRRRPVVRAYGPDNWPCFAPGTQGG
jgi:hypothetical protein